ncbi:MAG: bifunctional alpha,alpha-trehalose-phosphate synthase (UDP-forming)/trehalose-phosphatase [Bacteroidales bacterium]|nr:bifunctional alpha,alpha-trehalose-phosphate synthase (UDP-forming)/trehalose-phosphatase [Bacteroidales bacterium]
MMKDKPAKLIIVSNRLPVKADIRDEIIHFEKSAGGLATGLDSLDTSREKHWIGWSGIYTTGGKTEDKLTDSLAGYNFHPVFLTEEDTELYYEGYCNSTLWPLFHYFFIYTRHEDRYWEAYRKVNNLFLEKVREIATPDDIIWIQDYHLMLLPSLVREYLPSVRIGFFLHIPFPSYELFRTLENRNEILMGLVGADLIGFHTFNYMRHFISSLYRITGIESDDNTFHAGNRTFSVDTFPMGINFANFYEAGKKPGVRLFVEQFREQYKNWKIILSVDRLDYSKGIIQRLEAFRNLLVSRPEWINKVSLVMILVPSRDSVDRYNDLKVRIDETIGNINGTFSQSGWIPIHYYYKNFSFDELAAFYYVSHVALVTPLRDGMNLVAKEFVAAKAGKRGVLILSEMAGASIELTDAILVNPNNSGEIAEALNKALEMPADEQKERLNKMQRILKKQDIKKWAGDFIDELERIHLRQRSIRKKYLQLQQLRSIAANFRDSRRKLIILDYDGTLVPFYPDPALALPPPSLLKIIKKIKRKPGIEMAIVSGRNREFLEKVFTDPGIALFAEHGSHRRIGGEWKSLFRKGLSWQSEIIRIMQDVTDTTPGSFIERKETAVVWHYRNTDKWLADLRAAQLINKLIYPCTTRHLHLMKGEKIIEVKPSEYTKGTAIKNFYDFNDFDFILAAGDDTTDEDMFEALPENSVTIKIGKPSEKSRYTLANTSDFLRFLKLLIR